MEGISGLRVHDELVRLDSPLKVLFLSGHGDIPTAVESTRKGAVDWLVKGLPNDVFIDKVAGAMEAAEQSARYLRERAEVIGLGQPDTARKRRGIARSSQLGQQASSR
jgi:two-component system response regulator TtrR